MKIPGENYKNIYSTDEQIIGIWVDEKGERPLYRKTFEINNPIVNNQWTNVFHNIENIDVFFIEQAFYSGLDNGIQSSYFANTYFNPEQVILVDLWWNAINYKISGINMTGDVKLTVILNYTKTTDLKG